MPLIGCQFSRDQFIALQTPPRSLDSTWVADLVPVNPCLLFMYLAKGDEEHIQNQNPTPATAAARRPRLRVKNGWKLARAPLARSLYLVRPGPSDRVIMLRPKISEVR